MKKLIPLIILFFIINFQTTTAQIQAVQGDNISYHIADFINYSQHINTISFTITITNPTLLFIDSISLNDSIYANIERKYSYINCNFNSINQQNISLTIFATALNGNDSVAQLLFSNVIIDKEKIDINLPPINVHITSIGNNFYAKFANISNVYPSPMQRGEPLTIIYTIDVPSDITIYIFNEQCSMYFNLFYYDVDIGEHIIILNPDDFGINWFAGGQYFIKFISNSGESIAKFVMQ